MKIESPPPTVVVSNAAKVHTIIYVNVLIYFVASKVYYAYICLHICVHKKIRYNFLIFVRNILLTKALPAIELITFFAESV